jgi:hypothetical protein
MTEEPNGHVLVELFNERGRRVHAVEGENFISKLMTIHHRSRMRHYWNTYSLNKPAAYSIEGIDPLDTLAFPGTYVACWNDASTEDPATETDVRTDGNGIIACASVWPFGSTGAIRGNINTTESVHTTSTITRVFDWPTSAGNGTFQSVGYTSLQSLYTTGGAAAQTTPTLLVQPSLEERRRVTDAAGTIKAWATGAAVYSTAWCDRATGDVYLIVSSISTATPANTMRIYKLTNAQVNGASTHDGWGLYSTAQTPTLELTNFTPTGFTNPANYVSPKIAGKVGADWVVLYLQQQAGPQWRWALINGSTGATTRFVVLPVAGNTAGAVIGNDLYAFCTGTGNIYKYDVTTGSLTSTITIGAVPAGVPLATTAAANTGYAPQMTTDGTDLYLMMTGTVGTASQPPFIKLNTAGTVLGLIGSRSADRANETITAPYAAANKASPNLNLIEYQSMTIMGGSIAPSGFSQPQDRSNFITAATWFMSYQSTGQEGFLMWRNGRLWMGGAGISPIPGVGLDGTVPLFIAPVGYNLGSRVRLASPYTKTAALTMKITYTLNIPTAVP